MSLESVTIVDFTIIIIYWKCGFMHEMYWSRDFIFAAWKIDLFIGFLVYE